MEYQKKPLNKLKIQIKLLLKTYNELKVIYMLFKDNNYSFDDLYLNFGLILHDINKFLDNFIVNPYNMLLKIRTYLKKRLYEFYHLKALICPLIQFLIY